jgi:hypothetical protein
MWDFMRGDRSRPYLMLAALRLALLAVKAIQLLHGVLCPFTFMITIRSTPVFRAHESMSPQDRETDP